MRRIVYIVILAFFLASCTAVKEAAEPVAREKTPAERTDSVLLASIDEFLSLQLRDFLECVDVIMDKAGDVPFGRTVSIFKDGHPVLSVLFGFDETPSFIVGITLGGKVTFDTDPAILVYNLYDYIKACLHCRTEDDAVALVEKFNSTYRVNVLLEGRQVGALHMKTLEKEGKIVPGFVIDYEDGASCYLQLSF